MFAWWPAWKTLALINILDAGGARLPPSPAPAGRKHHPWQHLPWNAQFQQDRKLVQFVFRNRQRGFYIELGARDGKEHSNTYALEMAQGWSGILIDIFQNEECKKNRPHSTCIQACAAREEGIQTVVEAGLNTGFLQFVETDNASTTQRILCQTLPSILSKQEAPGWIDWLSLDVEGAELEVLTPLLDKGSSFVVDVISVETKSANALAYRQFMRNHSYWLVERMGLDDAHVREWTEDETDCRRLKAAGMLASMKRIMHRALDLIAWKGDGRYEVDKLTSYARNVSRWNLKRAALVARNKKCKMGELGLRSIDLLFNVLPGLESFSQAMCRGNGFEGDEIHRLLRPVKYDLCAPFFTLSLSRMSFVAAVQSDWPIFRLLHALCKRAFREFGGALIECSPLGFDLDLRGYVGQRLSPAWLRDQSMMCGAFSSVASYLQRARTWSCNESEFYALIEAGEKSLKAVAVEMEVVQLLAVVGQLRDEDNTWLLLNELQEKWLAYRASTPGVQRVRPGILEYFGPQKDSD